MNEPEPVDPLEAARVARIERVIGFALRADRPAPCELEWPCLYCSFVARASSEAGLRAAWDAHHAYIATHLDIATDPHFEAFRMDNLIGQMS